MFMQLLICAVLFAFGTAVSIWAIRAPDRKEVERMGRRDSHTP